MASAKSATTVVGEDKAPVTTLAIGEEHLMTTLVGEQAQPHPDYPAASAKSENVSATTIVGESWTPSITTVVGEGSQPLATTIVGEGGGGANQAHFTTTVVGEEGTTKMLGEEGPVITTIVGEGGPFGGY